MKIKRQYYCIVDQYNKPDYRFLFESFQEAQKKLEELKKTDQGETLFLSDEKRDYFPFGVKEELLSENKNTKIRSGCWSSLRISRVQMMDNLKVEKFFEQIRKSGLYDLNFSKLREREDFILVNEIRFPDLKFLQNAKKAKKRISDWSFGFKDFQWQTSFLRTRAFLATTFLLCITTLMSVFLINNYTTNKITDQLTQINALGTTKTVLAQTRVLGAKDEKLSMQFDDELNKMVLDSLRDFDKMKIEDLEEKIKKIVAGSPMEKMVPLIARQDKTVAAFLVGIAKKESNFGRRVPVLDGQDCYNYWGYRGIRDRMGTGGHTCFDSPEDAVNTVAKRITTLVEADVDTPQKMVLWKCGSSCDGHSDESVKKWISDVNIYFTEVNNEEKGG